MTIASSRRTQRPFREGPAAYRTALPGPVYCDTSALIKLYLSEAGSEEFNRVIEGRDDILVSDLAVTEIVSALARRLRQGPITNEVTRRLQQSICC